MVVTVKVEASTPTEANRALQVVVDTSGGAKQGRRLEQQTGEAGEQPQEGEQSMQDGAAKCNCTEKDAMMAQKDVRIAELEAQLKKLSQV
eukprot:COSAG04_NODE_7823_length_1061_cov_6.449138_1_plen_90_part_00